MEYQEAIKALNLKNPKVEINPLALIVNDEFDKPGKGNYRKNAVERTIKTKVQFHSECNTLTELVKKIIKIQCPYCNKEMTHKDSGGNLITTTINFNCICGTTIGITLGEDSIFVSPSKWNNHAHSSCKKTSRKTIK